MKLLPSQARAQGYQLDTSCYPWTAHRGERLNPDHACFTDDEERWLTRMQVFRSLCFHLASGGNVRDFAKALGISEGQMGVQLSIATLCSEIQMGVDTGKIKYSHAAMIAKTAANIDQQREFLRMLMEDPEGFGIKIQNHGSVEKVECPTTEG